MSGTNFNDTTVKPLGMLVEDPTTPTDGMSWLKLQRPISLSGAGQINGGIGSFNITIASSAPSDYSSFSTDFGKSGAVYVDMRPGMQSHEINIECTYGHLECHGGPNTTWGEMVTALNAWAVTNLSSGVASIISLSSTEDAAVEVTELVNIANLSGNFNGQPELQLKAWADGHAVGLPSIQIPTLTSDPYPVVSGSCWFLYIPEQVSTGFSGYLSVGMSSISINISSSSPEDIAYFTGGM